jgi:hypothetical protein
VHCGVSRLSRIHPVTMNRVLALKKRLPWQKISELDSRMQQSGEMHVVNSFTRGRVAQIVERISFLVMSQSILTGGLDLRWYHGCLREKEICLCS